MIKRLFEMSRLPLNFSREQATRIPCRAGSVYVRWIGSRWAVSASGNRTQYPAQYELREIVRGLCDSLGGTE